CLLDYISARVF
nr:immunoglobulin light chain junction region [Macaca mulatta]